MIASSIVPVDDLLTVVTSCSIIVIRVLVHLCKNVSSIAQGSSWWVCTWSVSCSWWTIVTSIVSMVYSLSNFNYFCDFFFVSIITAVILFGCNVAAKADACDDNNNDHDGDNRVGGCCFSVNNTACTMVVMVSWVVVKWRINYCIWERSNNNSS